MGNFLAARSSAAENLAAPVDLGLFLVITIDEWISAELRECQALFLQQPLRSPYALTQARLKCRVFSSILNVLGNGGTYDF